MILTSLFLRNRSSAALNRMRKCKLDVCFWIWLPYIFGCITTPQNTLIEQCHRRAEGSEQAISSVGTQKR